MINDRLGGEVSSSIAAVLQSACSIEMKKVSRFSALAVDTETKIHILVPSRAGNCFPARFLIEVPERFPSEIFHQGLNCDSFAVD